MVLKIFKFWCLCAVSTISAGNVGVEIGNLVDLFQHYGTLTRIFPNNANHIESSPPLEFSRNIFARETLRRITVSSFPQENGVWKINICENIPKLLKAFFENYNIDFVDNIENPFASIATRKSVSQFFGINIHFLLKGYFYILIKYRQNHARFEIFNRANSDFTLNPRMMDALANVSIGNEKSVLHFVSKIGTHYFESFSVGDVIFQLIAVPENHLECLKKFEPNLSYEDIFNCANATDIWPSSIKTLSNSKMVEASLNRLYKSNQGRFSNLFVAKYHSFPQFVRVSEVPVLTGFNLTVVSRVIPEPKSSFIHEVINNQMKLRDLYLYPY